MATKAKQANVQAQGLIGALDSIAQVMMHDLGLSRRDALSSERSPGDFDHQLSKAQRQLVIARGGSNAPKNAWSNYQAPPDPDALDLQDLNAGQTWRINRQVKEGIPAIRTGTAFSRQGPVVPSGPHKPSVLLVRQAFPGQIPTGPRHAFPSARQGPPPPAARQGLPPPSVRQGMPLPVARHGVLAPRAERNVVLAPPTSYPRKNQTGGQRNLVLPPSSDPRKVQQEISSRQENVPFAPRSTHGFPKPVAPPLTENVAPDRRVRNSKALRRLNLAGDNPDITAKFFERTTSLFGSHNYRKSGQIEETPAPTNTLKESNNSGEHRDEVKAKEATVDPLIESSNTKFAKLALDTGSISTSHVDSQVSSMEDDIEDLISFDDDEAPAASLDGGSSESDKPIPITPSEDLTPQTSTPDGLSTLRRMIKEAEALAAILLEDRDVDKDIRMELKNQIDTLHTLYSS